MNKERLAGMWRQFAARTNETWGELTCDPLRAAVGRRARIFEKAQQRSRLAKEESARQLRDFLHRNRNWQI